MAPHFISPFKFQLQHPDKVEALVLVNAGASKAGWTEWGYQKVHFTTNATKGPE